jgi:ketosteroid isomerase-like protein
MSRQLIVFAMLALGSAFTTASPALAQEHARDVATVGTGWSAPPSTVQDSVFEVVQEFFRAMAAGDVEASRRVLLPDGVRFSTRQSPEGPLMRRQSNEAYLEWLAQNEDALFEYIRERTVHLQGAIAVVWAPYDFYVNGAFSHCGTNAISLIRTAMGWQIASSLWTVELAGCEPSPAGRPGEA